jgi:hypothetical protein
LEAKFNTIEVIGGHSPYPGPARIFRLFLATVTPEKCAWFADVTLKSRRSSCKGIKVLEPSSDLLPIADFCRSYPHVKVRYIPGNFNYEQSNVVLFLFNGLFINKAVRWRNEFPISVMGASADDWTDAQGIARFNIPNIRIWPAVEEGVDLVKLIASQPAHRLSNSIQAWATEDI